MPPKKLTLEEVQLAIAAFREEHGTCPTRMSGPAASYFSQRISWSTVDLRLREIGTSLKQQAVELGYVEDRSLTINSIRAAIQRSYELTGKRPSQRSLNGPEVFGYRRSWASVDAWLRLHARTTLAKLARSVVAGVHAKAQVPLELAERQPEGAVAA